MTIAGVGYNLTQAGTFWGVDNGVKVMTQAGAALSLSSRYEASGDQHTYTGRAQVHLPF